MVLKGTRDGSAGGASGGAAAVKIDLGPIRDDLADKWEKVAPAVHRFAGHIIEQRIGATGSFDQDGDVFSIRLPGASPVTAAQIRREIKNDLYELLFGSDALDDDPAASRRKSRDAGFSRPRKRFWNRWLKRLRRTFQFEMAGGDGRPQALPPRGEGDADRAAADDEDSWPRVRSSRADGAAESHPDDVGREARGLPDNGSSAEPGAIERNVHAGPPHAPGRRRASGAVRRGAPSGASTQAAGAVSSSGDGRLREEETAAGASGEGIRPSAAHEAGRSSRAFNRVRRASTAALEQALANAAREAERLGDIRRPGLGFPPRGMKLLYRPMWYVPSAMLTTFTCLPACAMGPFEFVTGDAVLPKHRNISQVSMLDHLVVRDALSQLSALNALQMETLVCLPVHYDTLMGPNGADYFAVLSEIPVAIRNKIVFEIVDIDRGLGQLQTHTLIRRLRRRGRAVLGRLDLSDGHFALWRKSGLSYIGIDLENDDRPEDAILDKMHQFVVAAKRHDLKTYVRGLRSLSLAIAAIMSGYDYVDGPAINEGDLTLRTRPRKFALIDIYESLEDDPVA